MKLLSPKIRAALFTLTFAFSSSLTLAQTVWTDATGDWFTAGNWSAGVPNAATDAQVNNAGTAQVGAAGAAANSLTLGLNAADSGTVSVNLLGSLSVTSGIVVGDAGTGTLNITNGGTVSNGAATIGNTGGTGTATVDGAGSAWTNTGALNVGNDGMGTLNITNGGVVSNGSFAVIGNGGVGVATGVVTVDGAGSTWTNSGSLTVGDDGMGTLNITKGGTVSNSTAIIGDGGVLVTTGVVTVDGAGSKWNISDTLTVGDSGTGTLNITNGGTVSNAIEAVIGDSGTGMVTVDGVGSTWTNSGDLLVGDSAPGTLNITNGGTVSNGTTTIGDGAGAMGTVTVDGAGSTWTIGNLTVGDNGGPGTLTITNGATVSSGGATVANGAAGTVTVDGTGSSWTLAGSVFVGEGGMGTVNVTGGATLSSNGADLGEGSNAVVTVDGAGSTWTNTGFFDVSDGATATLNITNGGVVTTTSTMTISVGGTVIDDSSLVSPDVEINGGLLRGTGTVTGNVFNNSGTVAPGDAPGTLTITGNYTQSSGGTLQIQVGGTAAGQHDLLAIGGTASLDGTLQLVRLNNFTGAAGDKIIFLTAAGGVSGTFATVNTGTIVNVTVVYEPNDVALEFTQVAFASLTGLTRNQISVANELDEVSGDPRAAQLIAFLSGQPLGNLPHDFDLIAPEELASIYEIGFSQAVVQNMNLIHRMDDIRSGSTGYSGPVNQIPTGKDEAPISDKNVVSKNPVPAFVPCPENRWGVFALGSGDFVNVGDDDNNARGYSITTGSMLVGVDYRIGDHVAVGVDGEYASDTADLVDHGHVDVDGGKGGAFATVYGKGWFGSQIYVDLAGNGGGNSYDTRRTGLQNQDVRGSTDGTEWNGMLAYGSDWKCGNLTFGTWSSLQYTDVQFNHFTEHGSLAPLDFPDQDEDSFRTTSGIRASYEMKFGNCGFVRPEVRAAWQHEYGDTSYPIDARFASGAGDVFRVWGPIVGRDAALVDAGATLQWNARFSAYVFYDGVLGRSNYESNAVSGGIGFNF